MRTILRAVVRFMDYVDGLGEKKKVSNNFPFASRARKLSRGNMDVYSVIENYYEYFEKYDGQFVTYPERLLPYFNAILNRIEDYIKNQRIDVRKLDYDEINDIVHWRY